MTQRIEPGQTAEVEITVTDQQTADAMGNRGVRVYSTPHLVGLLEQAAHAAIRAQLPAEAGTVGTMVEVKHLAPTPVGFRVRARATVLETDGRRVLFQVEAWDDKEKIAEGRHERFVVGNLARFLERAMQKGTGGA
jgi:predicted thioesterase